MTQGVANANLTISSAARRLVADRCPGQRDATRLKVILSEHLAISPVTLNAKLRGDRQWDAEEVSKLAAFFREPVAYFYGEADASDFRGPVSRDRQLPRADSNGQPAVYLPEELHMWNLQAA